MPLKRTMKGHFFDPSLSQVKFRKSSCIFVSPIWCKKLFNWSNKRFLCAEPQLVLRAYKTQGLRCTWIICDWVDFFDCSCKQPVRYSRNPYYRLPSAFLMLMVSASWIFDRYGWFYFRCRISNNLQAIHCRLKPRSGGGVSLEIQG